MSSSAASSSDPTPPVVHPNPLGNIPNDSNLLDFNIKLSSSAAILLSVSIEHTKERFREIANLFIKKAIDLSKITLFLPDTPHFYNVLAANTALTEAEARKKATLEWQDWEATNKDTIKLLQSELGDKFKLLHWNDAINAANVQLTFSEAYKIVEDYLDINGSFERTVKRLAEGIQSRVTNSNNNSAKSFEYTQKYILTECAWLLYATKNRMFRYEFYRGKRNDPMQQIWKDKTNRDSMLPVATANENHIKKGHTNNSNDVLSHVDNENTIVSQDNPVAVQKIIIQPGKPVVFDLIIWNPKTAKDFKTKIFSILSTQSFVDSPGSEEEKNDGVKMNINIIKENGEIHISVTVSPSQEKQILAHHAYSAIKKIIDSIELLINTIPKPPDANPQNHESPTSSSARSLSIA